MRSEVWRSMIAPRENTGDAPDYPATGHGPQVVAAFESHDEIASNADLPSQKKRRRIIRRPEHKSSMTEQASWQHREEPDRELSEVENIDVPVAVEIEGG